MSGFLQNRAYVVDIFQRGVAGTSIGSVIAVYGILTMLLVPLLMLLQTLRLSVIATTIAISCIAVAALNVIAGSNAITQTSSPILNAPVHSSGTITRFFAERGFGVITTESGEQVYFHFTALQGQGFRPITEGMHVEFDLIRDPDRLRAANVAII